MLKKAIDRLENPSGDRMDDVLTAMRECLKSGVVCFDLFAAAIALRVENFEVAERYISGPSPLYRWGESGKGAVEDLKEMLAKKAKKKKAKGDKSGKGSGDGKTAAPKKKTAKKKTAKKRAKT